MRAPLPIFRKILPVLLPGLGIVLFALFFTSCEDEPILEPAPADPGGSYGKFESPDSLHLLQELENPEVF